MKVTEGYYIGVHDGVVVGLIIDLNNAAREAHAARDEDGAAALHRIFFHHFQNVLLKMRPEVLLAHLESLIGWHEHKNWRVYKTIDEPCLAFAAQKGTDGSVTLMALGLCYRFPPGGAEAWWTKHICPRVERLR